MSVPSTGLSKYELPGRAAKVGHNRGPPIDPLTVTVAETQRITGLGLTTIWALIAKKELESVLVRRRRLILFASLQRLLTPADDNQVTKERSAAARRLRAKRRKVKADTGRPNVSPNDGDSCSG